MNRNSQVYKSKTPVEYTNHDKGRMTSEKAAGLDDMRVELSRWVRKREVGFLTRLFNIILESERMPEKWRKSMLVQIFKNKCDAQKDTVE